MMSFMASATRRPSVLRMASSSSHRFARALSTRTQGDISSIPQADQVSPKLQVFSGLTEQLGRVRDNVEFVQGIEHKEHDKNITVKWMDGSDIDRCFLRTEEQKQAIEKELSQLQQMMQDAKRTFAVDAPDGEADWHVREEMEEINHIIDEQALLEDTVAVEKRHQKEAAEQEEAARIFAVDAADGDVDDDIHAKEEMDAINHIIDDQAALEDIGAVERQHQMEANDAREAARIFAVDAPDGDVDDDVHMKEDLSEVNHIIEDQAALEDAAAVRKQHLMEEQDAREAAKIFAVDGPDGDVNDDVRINEEREELNRIFEEQAKLEDKTAVEKRHQREAEDQSEAQKIYAVDAPDGRVDGFVKEEMEQVKHIMENQSSINRM